MFEFFFIERPTKDDLATAVDADVDGLLHAMHVRCERRDQDAALAAREDLAERLADDLLGLRHTGALRVRGVAEQEVDAAVADLGELADVGALTVDGRVVDLVVARVHDPPAGRLEDDRSGIGDRMGHADELDPKRPEVEGLVSGGVLTQIGIAQQPVLVELRLHEPEREPRRNDDRDPHLAHEVRQRADVILVAVREHDAADHRLAFTEVREVREDEVDAQMLVARETRDRRRRSRSIRPPRRRSCSCPLRRDRRAG